MRFFGLTVLALLLCLHPLSSVLARMHGWPLYAQGHQGLVITFPPWRSCLEQQRARLRVTVGGKEVL